MLCGNWGLPVKPLETEWCWKYVGWWQAVAIMIWMFPKWWGYLNSWMVYNGKSETEMDDLGVTPFLDTYGHLHFNIFLCWPNLEFNLVPWCTSWARTRWKTHSRYQPNLINIVSNLMKGHFRSDNDDDDDDADVDDDDPGYCASLSSL